MLQNLNDFIFKMLLSFFGWSVNASLSFYGSIVHNQLYDIKNLNGIKSQLHDVESVDSLIQQTIVN